MIKKKEHLVTPLRSYREDLGLTRPQVRELTGIPERTLLDYELGKYIPTLENTVALAKVYKKSLKEMVISFGIDTSGIPDDQD